MGLPIAGPKAVTFAGSMFMKTPMGTQLWAKPGLMTVPTFAPQCHYLLSSLQLTVKISYFSLGCAIP
jgi:hypothetical protein